MQKHRFSAVLILIILVAVYFSGCQLLPTNAELAESFTRLALTVPSDEISEIIRSELTVGTVEYDEQLQAAVNTLCQDYAADSLKDPAGAFYRDIIVLHTKAAHDEYTYTVNRIDIKELSKTEYRYQAEISASHQDEPLTVLGNIRFDGEDKISDMEIHTMQ